MKGYTMFAECSELMIFFGYPNFYQNFHESMQFSPCNFGVSHLESALVTFSMTNFVPFKTARNGVLLVEVLVLEFFCECVAGSRDECQQHYNFSRIVMTWLLMTLEKYIHSPQLSAGFRRSVMLVFLMRAFGQANF